MQELIRTERAPFLERLGLRRARGRVRDGRFEAFFEASPVPTYVWRRDGDDLVLIAHNDAADSSSGGRAASYLGRRAVDVYGQDEPEILDDLRRCLNERARFRREMSYTVPGTDETYDLGVTYAFAPPDLVLVHLVDVTEERRAARELTGALAELRGADRERRHLLRELVTSQEQERERLAADLHDDTIQQLVAITLMLDTLERVHPQTAGQVARLQDVARTATERLRHLAFALHPPSIHTEGLAVAVASLLDHIAAETGLRCALVDDLRDEASCEVEIHAYRVIQEALMNVRKHARARSVEVKLEREDGTLVATVRDDGVGFDPAGASGEHFGLATMRQRADLLGGTLEVTSEIGDGTTVRLELPLRPRRGRR